MDSVKELAKLEQQNREWNSWRSFCKHFEEITGKDINQPKFGPMVEALKRWGEELVILRDNHPLPDHHLEEIRRIAPIHPDVDTNPDPFAKANKRLGKLARELSKDPELKKIL